MRVLVRATGADAGEWRVLAEGDRVTATGVVTPLQGFDVRMRWQHAVATLSRARLERFGPPRSPPYVVANALRAAIARGCAPLDPTDRSLLAGFLLGDTRGIPPVVSGEFRAAGLSHLLAVSGENVAFVLALVGPMLRRCSLRGRLLLGLAVLVVFGCVTRFEPSVLRAEVMAGLAMAAAFVGRPVPAGRLLCSAVVVLLLIDPFLLHSLGFQLSVAATAAIVALSPAVAARLPGPGWWREALAVPLAAQLGVTPILLVAQGSVPLLSPVANLVAVPLAEPLTVGGFMVAGAGALLARPVPRLASVGLAPLAALLGWVRLVAHVTAAVPVVLDTRGALAAVGLVSAVTAVRRIHGGSLRADVPRARGAVPDDPPR